MQQLAQKLAKRHTTTRKSSLRLYKISKWSSLFALTIVEGRLNITASHMIIPKRTEEAMVNPNDKEVKTAAMESRSEQPGSSQKVENDDDASVAESDAGSEEASAMAEVSALPSAWVQQAKAACRAEKTSASAGSTKDRRAIFTPEPMGKYSFLIHTYSQSQSSLALIVRSAVLIAHSFSNSYQSLRCFF